MKKINWFNLLLWSFVIASFVALFTPYSSWLPYVIIGVGVVWLNLYLHNINRKSDEAIRNVYNLIKGKKEYYKVCGFCGEKLMLSEKKCTKCGKDVD